MESGIEGASAERRPEPAPECQLQRLMRSLPVENRCFQEFLLGSPTLFVGDLSRIPLLISSSSNLDFRASKLLSSQSISIHDSYGHDERNQDPTYGIENKVSENPCNGQKYPKAGKLHRNKNETSEHSESERVPRVS